MVFVRIASRIGAALRQNVSSRLDATGKSPHTHPMRVISRRILREFWARHPDAEGPLRQWFAVASAAEWVSLADVRTTYRHADAVVTASGERLTVFNVGGNKYRLVVRIRYDYRLVNVRRILTHAEYDRGRWKE